MATDPHISSIIHRYELDQPVSTEEKALLHRWLMNTLQSRIRPVITEKRNKLQAARRKLRVLEWLFIGMMIVMLIFIIYIISNPAGNGKVRFHYQEFRESQR